MVMVVAVIIGFGKGLRTVFMALVIPTYVPLEKLPGATGIQLLTAGIVYLTLGPVVGRYFFNFLHGKHLLFGLYLKKNKKQKQKFSNNHISL